MHTYEERIRAVELYIRLGKRLRATIRELGYPQLSGRVMLFDQWTGGRGIADPYRKPEEFHREVIGQIQTAATAWAARLKPRS